MDTNIYVVDKSTFKELVQRLTGQQPPEAAVAQDETAPATVAGASAPRRGRLTVRWMATAVQNPPAFKPAHQQHYRRPKLPIIRPARSRLAGFVSPTAPSPPPSPWIPDGPCVLNKQGELPPSPPSASTLAEEVSEAAEEMTTQEGRPDHMHQSPPPPPPPVRNREPKLLNLFPLTPSCSKDC